MMVVGLSACKKDQPAPALAGGECNLVDTGFGSEAAAKTAMDNIQAILRDYKLGDSTLHIVRAQTYVSQIKRKDPNAWGYQIVFNCEDAAITREDSADYWYSSDRDAAYNNRLHDLNTGDKTKVISSGKSSYDTNCDTWYDDQGYSYESCDTYYNYSITYITIINSGLMKNTNQDAIVSFYQQINQAYSALRGKNLTVSDSLDVAAKVIPSFTEEGKLVRDWKNLSDLLDQALKPKKTYKKK